MSKLSFKTFCIEFYSQHIQKPGPEVFELFRTSGLLKMLDSDYEDLHGMGIEALMQFFDEYLETDLKELMIPHCGEYKMIEHSLVRAVNMPKIIQIINKYYNISENEALQRFYQSKTAENYADEETGLYGQSSLFIAGMFITEQDGVVDELRFTEAS